MTNGLFVELICKKKRDIVQNEHFEWNKMFLDFNARSVRTAHLKLIRKETSMLFDLPPRHQGTKIKTHIIHSRLRAFVARLSF